MVTLKEHLSLYAAARGIPLSKRNETVNALVFFNYFNLLIQVFKLRIKGNNSFRLKVYVKPLSIYCNVTYIQIMLTIMNFLCLKLRKKNY